MKVLSKLQILFIRIFWRTLLSRGCTHFVSLNSHGVHGYLRAWELFQCTLLNFFFLCFKKIKAVATETLT